MRTENNDKYLDSIEIPDMLISSSDTFGLSLKEMLRMKGWPIWSLPRATYLIFLLRHLIKQENHIKGLVHLFTLYETSQELSDKKIEELEKRIEKLESGGKNGQTKTKN